MANYFFKGLRSNLEKNPNLKGFTLCIKGWPIIAFFDIKNNGKAALPKQITLSWSPILPLLSHSSVELRTPKEDVEIPSR